MILVFLMYYASGNLRKDFISVTADHLEKMIGLLSTEVAARISTPSPTFKPS